MKVDTQNIGPCKVKVIVKAEADETRSDYEEVVKAFMLHGRVPGFRQGKVPREIIKRDFHKDNRRYPGPVDPVSLSQGH